MEEQTSYTRGLVHEIHAGGRVGRVPQPGLQQCQCPVPRPLPEDPPSLRMFRVQDAGLASPLEVPPSLCAARVWDTGLVLLGQCRQHPTLAAIGATIFVTE
jgi:hypothetical protein